MMWNHGNNGVKQREQKVTEQSWELTKNNDERRENCASNRHNMYFEIIILQNVFISIFRYFVLNLNDCKNYHLLLFSERQLHRITKPFH